ncbi:MAG: UDP-N-acetylmuramate--L-alanine ligase [Thermoflexales bacterium]|nr:UDP-N-acetylmuramate--L-alanine ligase [Thermoflexales bacterium]MCS7325569.1 UDP-N-acetylmuramate--L-alanine ligase [Thermoflexales bacterium]MDW8054631.1 UDP-N-acetylmuramate--L-alanine ligase [Anaerolineae bacterium]
MSLLGEHVHILGIGGAGMSAIARVLHARGVCLSGDDRVDSPALAALRAEGIPVFVGHDPAHLEGVTLVVPSSAVPKDEPELCEARQRGIPVWHRGDLLAALLEGKLSVAVAGTHGKSTTTAMLATIFTEAGLDPSFIIGATPINLGTNARAGSGDLFVLEADEYDHTFLRFRPNVAIITNVEFDHPDTFADADALVDAFAQFARSVPREGLIVACADDDGCVAALQQAQPQATVVDYGVQRGMWRVVDARPNALGGVDFEFHGAGVSGEVAGRCSLRIPGEHNALNALAALIVAEACGVPVAEAVRALGGYKGAARRFELRGEVRGVRVIDDYAHHPTEIRATLRAARMRYPLANVWAVWQPHTYSRTLALLDDFARAFDDADHVLVLPIYAARERAEDFASALETLNPIALARRIQHPDVHNAASFDDALGLLLAQVRGGDVVITLSAGDGNAVGERLLAMLR